MAAQLDGQVAPVTGGASGAGRATALASRRAGARPMISNISEAGGRETVDLVVKGGGEALFTNADVIQGSAVRALVGKTVEAYGRPDCAFTTGCPGAESRWPPWTHAGTAACAA